MCCVPSLNTAMCSVTMVLFCSDISLEKGNPSLFSTAMIPIQALHQRRVPYEATMWVFFCLKHPTVNCHFLNGDRWLVLFQAACAT